MLGSWLSILKSNGQKSLPGMTARKENIFLLNTHKISMNGRYYFNSDDDDD